MLVTHKGYKSKGACKGATIRRHRTPTSNARFRSFTSLVNECVVLDSSKVLFRFLSLMLVSSSHVKVS